MPNVRDDGMPDHPRGAALLSEAFRRHEPFAPRWDDAPCGPDELDAKRGLFLRAGFPDPEGLLDSVHADFGRFLAEAGLAGGAVPVPSAGWPGPRIASHPGGTGFPAAFDQKIGSMQNAQILIP